MTIKEWFYTRFSNLETRAANTRRLAATEIVTVASLMFEGVGKVGTRITSPSSPRRTHSLHHAS